MFVFTERRHQIRDLLIENIFRTFGPTAARGTIESIDRFIVVGRDLASRLGDSLRRERLLGSLPLIDLAIIRRANIVALRFVLPRISHSIGARSHCLSL